jgi:hypothetical protein
MAREWNIRSQGDACSLCGKAFEAGEKIVSGLYPAEDGGEGYLRRDVCQSCAAGAPAAPFGQWQGVFTKSADARPKDPIARETAEDLLRRLVDVGDPENTGVIYILAVMLERKKQLIERSAVPVENGVMRFYEHKATGDAFRILDPQIRLEDIPAIQERIAQMLP